MSELKVYYGWAKIGKIRKKRAISVIFENEWNGCRSERGQRILRAAQETVIERYQDAEEEKAAKDCNRIFTEYSLFLNEKPINGSLNKILQMNSDADKKHVSKECVIRLLKPYGKPLCSRIADIENQVGNNLN